MDFKEYFNKAFFDKALIGSLSTRLTGLGLDVTLDVTQFKQATVKHLGHLEIKDSIRLTSTAMITSTLLEDVDFVPILLSALDDGAHMA